MHVPGLGQDGTKPEGAGSGPEGGLVFDLREQVGRRGLASVEDAVVAVLPYHPWDEEGRGGEALAHGHWGDMPRRAPPVVEGDLSVGRGAGEPEPVQNLMPNLSGEGAGEGEVGQGLGGLITTEAACGVLQAAAGEAVAGARTLE